MNRHRLGFLIVTLALSINAPAFAHDMAEMEESDGHDMAPNAMGGQMGMGAHMVMTSSRPQAPNDIERAHDLINTLRRVLARYHDSRVALSEGYRIFLPTVPQEVYHFTDYGAASQEYSGHFDPARPGSLLYVKNSGGDYVLVGDIGATHLDMPGMMPVASSPSAPGINRRLGFLADGRFGFTGKIADAAECEAAGGHFLKQAFGWMIHVYPFNGDDLKVAFGMSVPTPPTN